MSVKKVVSEVEERCTICQGSVKLVEFTESEKMYFQKLPLALRQKISTALQQPELIPPDRRRGENSHWHEKRTLKVFIVKTPNGRKRPCTTTEAANLVDCSEEFLVAHMNNPLSKFERVRTYVMSESYGETIVMWAPGRAP